MSRRLRGGRSLARRQALQLLFQAEACGRDVSDVIDGGEYAVEVRPLDAYAERVARGAGGLLPELDRAIDARSQGWAVTRMPAVDRNILRLAVYEMCAVDEVEAPVAINEAVDLAKLYGTDESPRFVNGLLGRVADDLAAGHDVLLEASTPAAAEDAAASGVAADLSAGVEGGLVASRGGGQAKGDASGLAPVPSEPTAARPAEGKPAAGRGVAGQADGATAPEADAGARGQA